jgi:hypothetical protein
VRQFIYSISCECGWCYFGETGRPTGIWIWEHMNNSKQGLTEKSRLAKHAYEEGHHIQWKEAKAVQIETSNICRKYMEVAHMACFTNRISLPSLEISPILIPLICEEVGRLQSSLYKPGSSKQIFMLWIGTSLIEFYRFFIDLSSHFSLLLSLLFSFVVLIVLYIDSEDFSYHFYLYFIFCHR